MQRYIYISVILFLSFYQYALALPKTETENLRKHDPVSISLGGKINNVPFDSGNVVNIQLGLPCSRINNLNGFGFNLISGNVTEQMKGLSISGINSINKQGMLGANIAGLLTYTQNRGEGVLITGGLNVLYGQMRGLQLSGVSNFNIGKVKGVQISGISNFNATGVNGFQLSALNNVAGGEMKGMQLSGFLNVSMDDMHGVQLGIVNYAKRVKGAQIGIINASGRSVKGVQLGIINYSYDTARVQLGLVNMNPKTRINGIIYGGNMTAINFGIRFMNRYTYSILAVGYPYDHNVADFSGAFTYRYGLYKAYRRFTFSADLGYSHINLVSEKEHIEVPNMLWSVQARGNISFRICKYFGVFVTGGYQYAAKYGTFDSYRHKPLYEFGVSFF
ncbi:MAG: LA_2272 family surface repeat-containing protein [Bacteroidales bacterium]